jgi:hypothetical protein
MLEWPLMQQDAVYAYGWFKPPASPLPEGATTLPVDVGG